MFYQECSTKGIIAEFLMMLQQEAAGHTFIKTESSNGAMETTTPPSQNVVFVTTETTNMTVPEPMDQDGLSTIQHAQSKACPVQGVTLRPVVSQIPQMFPERAVSVASLLNSGKNLFIDIL